VNEWTGKESVERKRVSREREGDGSQKTAQIVGEQVRETLKELRAYCAVIYLNAPLLGDDY
jgi:hypothetical protein